jgi:hypothetical protein
MKMGEEKHPQTDDDNASAADQYLHFPFLFLLRIYIESHPKDQRD